MNQITVKRKKNANLKSESLDVYVNGKYMGNVFVTEDAIQTTIHCVNHKYKCQAKISEATEYDGKMVSTMELVTQ